MTINRLVRTFRHSMSNSRRGPLVDFLHRLLESRLVRFAAVGTSGVVVNLGALYVGVELVRLPDVVASAMAIELSIVSNFILNNALTFRDRNAYAAAGLMARMIRYNLVSLLGLGIQLGTFYVLNRIYANVRGVGDPGAFRYASQVAGIAIATAWNFVSHSRWTWGQRTDASSSLRCLLPAKVQAMTNPSILILLPTYNEAGNVERMLGAIHESLPAADVLVIDDNSPDGTGKLAADAAEKNAWVKVAHRPGKQGLGVAYRYGYGWALAHGYDRVLQMDCDFSHDPRDLPRMVKLLDDHPAVVGSRRVFGGGSDGWPWYRNAISGAGSFYARAVLSSRVRDLTTGFKGFRGEVLRVLPVEQLRTDGFGFQIEVTATLQALGIEVHEMPIRFADRTVGESKMSTQIFLEALLKVWDIRSGIRKLCDAGRSPARTRSIRIQGSLAGKV